jgi:hypothetical protein
MKKILFLLVILVTACSPQTLAPVEPTEIYNLYPTMLPTPTLAVVTRPIEGELVPEALNFFYELKIHMASKEYEHFAEEVRYPITINVDSQPKTFIFAAELTEYIPRIFTPEEISRLIAIDETELTFTPNGVKVADGIIWFDLICLDAECGDPEFLITQINN